MNIPEREPARGDVFVWSMACASPSAALVARWRADLDEAERAQADRFHFEVDRTTYLAAHWLLRNALAAVARVAPHDWRFVARRHGKPDVAPGLGPAGLQ